MFTSAVAPSRSKYKFMKEGWKHVYFGSGSITFEIFKFMKEGWKHVYFGSGSITFEI